MVLLSTALQNLGNYPAPGAAVTATAPSNPTTGRTWFDTGTNELKVYDGQDWQIAAAGGSVIFPTIFKFTEVIFNSGSSTTPANGTVSFDGATPATSTLLCLPEKDATGSYCVLRGAIAEAGVQDGGPLYFSDGTYTGGAWTEQSAADNDAGWYCYYLRSGSFWIVPEFDWTGEIWLRF